MARYIFGSIYRQMLEAVERYGIVSQSKVITHLQALQKEESKYSDSRILDFFGQYIREFNGTSTKPLYLLVDGIDECPEAVEIAQTLARLAFHSKSVRVLLTCRPERKIEEALLNCLRIETTNETFAPDRLKYVEWNLSHDERLKNLEPEIKEKVKNRLLSTNSQVYPTARPLKVLTVLG